MDCIQTEHAMTACRQAIIAAAILALQPARSSADDKLPVVVLGAGEISLTLRHEHKNPTPTLLTYPHLRHTPHHATPSHRAHK